MAGNGKLKRAILFVTNLETTINFWLLSKYIKRASDAFFNRKGMIYFESIATVGNVTEITAE